MTDKTRTRKNPTGYRAKKTDGKTRPAILRFIDKFKQVVTHEGDSRNSARKGDGKSAYKTQTQRGHGKRNRGVLDSGNNGRRKAKIKARNRRNRKLTRALHQRERLQS